jgi:hypothetical protein
VYKKLKKPLTQNQEVHVPHLMELIHLLSLDEESRLIEVYQNPPKLGFLALSNCVTEKRVMYQTSETVYRNVEPKIEYSIQMEQFSELWNLKNFGPAKEMIGSVEKLPPSIISKLFSPTDVKLSELVQTFVSAFPWTFIYYKHGTYACNPNFLFNYNYAPLLKDVVKFYRGRIDPSKREQVNMDYSLPVLLQLLAVLPPRSKNALPPGLAKMMTCDSPIADLFPIKVFVDTDGKDMERLGIVQISFVSPIRLFSIEDQIEMSEEELEKYVDDENIVFVLDENKVLDRNLNPSQVVVKSQVVPDPKEVVTYVEATVPVVLASNTKSISAPKFKK